MSNPIHNIEGNWEISLAGDGDTSAVCTLHKPAIFIYHRKRTMFKFSSVLSIASVLSIFCPSFALAQFVDSPLAQRFAGKEKLSDRVYTQSQVSAQVPNIQGEWKMSIIGENLSSTYSLIQKGNLLTGTFRAPLGTFPITGTITKDNKINFSAKVGGGMNLKFAGTVDGKTMKGLADIPMKGRRNWTATQ
jgi:hypothetical protein